MKDLGKNAAPFLSWLRVPESEWHQLTPAEHDLHLFWVKKLVPLFYDSNRVSSDHLSAGDRRRIQRVLTAISLHQIPFGPTLSYDGSCSKVDTIRGPMLIEGEHITVQVVAKTARESDSISKQSLSLQVYGTRSDIEVVFKWEPQADRGRGSVCLYPQAAKSKHRFAIAAFNQQQFADICDALLRYAHSGTSEPDD